MSLRRFVMAAAAAICCVAPAGAQGVKLQFDSGRVSVSAQNVPLRTILNEWARLGGTKIVNGERVPGGLVTIELANVPERQALDTLLRAASGYLAGPRPAGTPGASAFSSILILPTSSAPRPSGPPSAAAPPIFPVPQPQPAAPFPGQGRQIPGRQVAPPPDPDDDPSSDVPPPEDDPDDAPPQRGRVVGGVVQPTQPRPFQPGDDDPPAGPVASPANPFGIPAGSARPGEITPVPQQPPQPRSRPDPEP